MMRISDKLLLAMLPLVLVACASSARRPATVAETGQQIAEAATTPLTDLNLVRAEIPAVLAAAQKEPYALPPDRSCSALAAEIEALDSVLGADLDTTPTETNPGLVERGVVMAANAAVDAVRDVAEDVVPYRSWVRKLSGAERYSKDVEAAIAAGTIRRAFLKGVGRASNCAAPAAPRR